MKNKTTTQKTTGASPEPALRWDSGIRWDSGLRWPGAAPLTTKINMATITTNISGLNILQKTEKGITLISMGTDNALVPGNAASLAAFSAAQDALFTANADVQATRDTLAHQIALRDAAELDWNDKCTKLATFTQMATGGVETSILSSGFGVRGPNVPKPPLSAPANVSASLNGSPGNTKVKWTGVTGAVSYLVEMSPDPMTPTSWVQVATPTKTSCDAAGAQPGKLAWFRVAGVNNTGAGPWSTPAQREVM